MLNEKKAVKITSDDGTVTYKETAVTVKDGSDTHIMTNENEELKTKAVRAGDAVTDLVDSALDKVIDTVKTKSNELLKSGVLEPGYASIRKDSADIGRLGHRVTGLAAKFEETMTTVRNQPYEHQVQILTGYRKLLEEQINVIDSRINFVKRVR